MARCQAHPMRPMVGTMPPRVAVSTLMVITLQGTILLQMTTHRASTLQRGTTPVASTRMVISQTTTAVVGTKQPIMALTRQAFQILVVVGEKKNIYI